MFDPAQISTKKKEKAAMRAACARIVGLVTDMLPSDVRDLGVKVTAKEVICGDPECAPIDTSVEFWYDNGITQAFSLPMLSVEVTQDDLNIKMPTAEILHAWGRGEDPEWPAPDPPPDDPLTFGPSDKVEIYISSANIWESGVIDKIWYRDRDWPIDVYMPYLVRLARGGTTYAPEEEYVRAFEPDKRAKEKARRREEEEDEGGNRRRVRARLDSGDVVQESKEGLGAEEQRSDADSWEDGDDGPTFSLHEPSWRFQVGDRVLCNLGSDTGFEPGVVFIRDIMEPNDEEFRLIPYSVELDNGGSINVPYDVDHVIRAAGGNAYTQELDKRFNEGIIDDNYGSIVVPEDVDHIVRPAGASLLPPSYTDEQGGPFLPEDVDYIFQAAAASLLPPSFQNPFLE